MLQIEILRKLEKHHLLILESKFSFAKNELADIKKAGLYRKMTSGKIKGPHITINGVRLLNFCSNDYLGIRPRKISATQMQSSSRLLSGDDSAHRALENKLAKLKSAQASLLYPTGYMANIGMLGSVAGPGDLILSDQLNHASIIQAARLSGATISIYRHNDTADLERKLNVRARRKFVVTEGIFSMDGDYANLAEISGASTRYDAILMLDDAHGDFVAGGGRGTAHYLKAGVDIHTSSLSKALGSFGGYAASRLDIIDLCINKSKSFIFTSALPSALAEHALSRLENDLRPRRSKLAQNVQHMAKGIRQIQPSCSVTHIMPVMIGDEGMAVRAAKFLYRNGIFAQAIRYPTVPKRQARIRLSVTAWLSKKQIDYALAVLERMITKFGIS